MFERLAEGVPFYFQPLDTLFKQLSVLLHLLNTLFISCDHAVTLRINQTVNQSVYLFLQLGCFGFEALHDGAIAIDLIDGERLCELLKQYGLGVRTEMIERVIIEEDWFSGG